MVNKAMLGILVVVVVASMGVGALIGMQLGGDGADGIPADDSSSNDDDDREDVGETALANETNETNATTETRVNETTTQTEVRTTIPPRRFDRRAIRSHVTDKINDLRANKGLEPMAGDTTTADEVSAMAREHSVAMADAGTVAHTINETTSADRYRNHDLYERCKLESDTGEYIVHPDNDRLEVIGRTVAGQEYQDDGETAFNGDERSIAEAIVSEWREQSRVRDKLLYQNANTVGVGVEITDAGYVYVTANVCN